MERLVVALESERENPAPPALWHPLDRQQQNCSLTLFINSSCCFAVRLNFSCCKAVSVEMDDSR